MPKLYWIKNDLILSLEDAHEFAQNPDTKLFLSSILDMDYDDQWNYYYRETNDFVKLAMVTQRIIKYLDLYGLFCELDNRSQTIIDTLTNSEKELQNSVRIGLEIKGENQVVPSIPGFVRQLKNYQVTPVNHAVNSLHVANFSVPGSGKTTVAYATFAILKEREVVNKIMVIGPRSSFMPWEEEFEACFGRKVNSIRINSRQDNLVELIQKKELILLTYQMASIIWSRLIEVLCKFKTLLVLDESHNIKRFKRGIWAKSTLKIAPYAKRRLILTGTPMPNSLLDLWSQFTFLWPFRNLLGESPAYQEIAESNNGLERIRNMIQPFYTRITKNQLNLPKPSFNIIKVPMNRVQNAIYSALEARTLAELNEVSIRERVQLRQWRKNKIIRLLQAASNPSLLTEYSEDFRIPPLSVDGMSVVSLIQNYTNYEVPCKLIETAKLTKELIEKGEKVLIWTTFVHNIKTLTKNLQKVIDTEPIMICGETPKDEDEDLEINREKYIREFKTDKNPRVLITNPHSLAESVSLHKICKNAIYVDRTFNAGHYIQSLDRIHRIGLKADDLVTYHIFLSTNTIDEVIADRLNEKYNRMLSILNDDFSVIDLDTDIIEISDNDFEKDFEAVYKQLKANNSGE